MQSAQHISQLESLVHRIAEREQVKAMVKVAIDSPEIYVTWTSPGPDGSNFWGKSVLHQDSLSITQIIGQLTKGIDDMRARMNSGVWI